jgi:DNA-binding beta-propeller fold protein YncE
VFACSLGWRRRAVLAAAFSVAAAILPAGARASSVYAVANGSATIAQYDIAAGGRLTPKTPTGVAAGTDSYDIAITPDGKSAYVANYDTDSVLQYNIGAGGALSPKTPGSVATGVNPVGVAVSPDGKSVYVTDTGSHQVSQYNVGAGGLLTPKTPAAVAAGSYPYSVAVSPHGTSVYVADFVAAGVVWQYDVAPDGRLTPKSPPSVTAGDLPSAVSITPDGRSVYVANYGSSSVGQYDVDAGGRLNPKTTATVSAGASPDGLAVSPNGRSVYVTNLSGAGGVWQFDVGPGELLNPKNPVSVPSDTDSWGIAVTPDGKSVYAGDHAVSGTISQYDAGAGGLLAAKTPASVPTGSYPQDGVVVSPDVGPIAAFTATPGSPGLPTSFDASASTESDFAIATYNWNFGDGHAQASVSPTIQHVYTRPGAYTVTLTVSDQAGCSLTMIFTGQTASCSGSSKARSIHRVTIVAPVPHIAKLAIRPRAIVPAKRGGPIVPAGSSKAGAIVSYTDSLAATTTFTVQRAVAGRHQGHTCARPSRGNRKHRRCTRFVNVGGFRHLDAAGANSFRFSGRLHGKRLPRGQYRLHAVPRAGRVGAAANAAFRVMR